jgi:hypothetical protein
MTNIKKQFAEMRKKKIAAIKTASFEEKAVYLIEHLLPEDEEFKPLSVEDAAEHFRKIFHYVHGACKWHICYDVHDDWRKEIAEDFAKAVKRKGG